MQPHRYFNELDHWRNNAQRPHPTAHSPPSSPPMKPSEEKSDPFAVEGPRGWLAYTEDDTFEKDKDTAKKKLPAVSNAKILELTKMTDQLAERTQKQQHQQRPRKKEQRTFASTEHLPSNSYPSPTRPSVSTPSPSKSERRRSWYKHLMKRDKGKGRATTDDDYSSNASSIDPRLHHPGVFGSESSHPSLHRRTSSDVPKQRRVSLDSEVPVILSSPESVHEEPEPIEFQEDHDQQSSSGEEDEQQSYVGEDQEQELLFDYDALPDEVLGLLREYEKQGKVKIEEQRVKHYNNDDEEEEDAVDASRLVSTIHDDDSSVTWRRIATVRANRSDKAEFVKLVHLTDGKSMRNGYLLDLHVSMLGDNSDEEENNTPEDLQQLLRQIDGRIETLQTLTQDAKQFMEENREAIDALAFEEEGDNNSPWPSPANSSRQTSAKSIHSIKEAAALEEKHPTTKKRSATLSSASSRRYSSSIHRVPSLLLDPHLPYDSINPFDYRQEEVRLGVCALENEMGDFKRDLQITEELIRDIQIDINDTRLRMSSYIKDIPETHYSALKKLEVDVESILANRAKNPWLDTGYALLSYLLTLCALLVWIIICGLKWGKTVILFPRKLWRTYTEYLVERDKAVKKASIRSVASGVDRNRPLHPHHQ